VQWTIDEHVLLHCPALHTHREFDHIQALGHLRELPEQTVGFFRDASVIYRSPTVGVFCPLGATTPEATLPPKTIQAISNYMVHEEVPTALP